MNSIFIDCGKNDENGSFLTFIKICSIFITYNYSKKNTNIHYEGGKNNYCCLYFLSSSTS